MLGHIIIIRFWRNTRPRFRFGDDADRPDILMMLVIMPCKMADFREREGNGLRKRFE
jgi:hypothetical protein